VDLLDLWRGELSVRRLSALIENLPPDSATEHRLSGIPRGWDRSEFLTADLFHALTGEPHPDRPKPSKAARHRELVARLEQQRARMAAAK